jgi:hypothetical protein
MPYPGSDSDEGYDDAKDDEIYWAVSLYVSHDEQKNT